MALSSSINGATFTMTTTREPSGRWIWTSAS
jgi:hypothetical protein